MNQQMKMAQYMPCNLTSLVIQNMVSQEGINNCNTNVPQHLLYTYSL